VGTGSSPSTPLLAALGLPVIREAESPGFTLLEVLVAFVVAGLAVAAAISAFGSGIAGADRAGQQMRALILAESKLSELSTLKPLATGQQEGRFAAYTWRATVTAMKPSTGTDGSVLKAYRLDVEVSDTNGSQSLVHLKTVRIGVEADQR